MGDLVNALHRFEPAVLQRPELGGERAGRRLEQRRQIQMIGAEAHAELAQGAARLLRRAFISSATRERSSTPSASPIWKATPRATPSSPSPVSRSSSAPSSFFTCCASQRSRRAWTFSSCGAAQGLVGDQFHAGLQDVVARRDLADRFAEPANDAVIGEDEGLVHRLVHAPGARLDLGRHAFCAAAFSVLASSPSASGSGVKQNPEREPTW